MTDAPLSAETIVRAQHEETGRMWEGPRSQLPPRFVEVGSSKTSALEAAFEAGWRTAANWMERDDLHADIGSPAYAADMHAALADLRNAPETPPVHAVVFEAFKTGRQSVLDEQAEKTDTDIERLRQIADEIEYPMPGTATRLREIAQRYEIVAGA